MSIIFDVNFIKVLDGCDCCEIDGKLVEDGYSWISDNKEYGQWITKKYSIVL